MADKTIKPFASEVLDRVRRSSQLIGDVSKTTDVDSLAIAGSIAREMNKFKFDYTKGAEGLKRKVFASITPSNEKRTDAELWADYRYVVANDVSRDTPLLGYWNRFWNPLLRDVGPGRIEELNAMNALIWYMWKHPDEKDDPLGLKAKYAPEGKLATAKWRSLIKDYKGEPGKGDAADGFDLTVKLAANLLQKDKDAIVAAVGGEARWNSLSKVQQSELLISDYTIGWSRLRELIEKNRKANKGTFSTSKLDEFTGADYLLTGDNLKTLRRALSGKPPPIRINKLPDVFPGFPIPVRPLRDFRLPLQKGVPIILGGDTNTRGALRPPFAVRPGGEALQPVDLLGKMLRRDRIQYVAPPAQQPDGDAIALRQEGDKILPSILPSGLAPEDALQLSRSAPATLWGYHARYPTTPALSDIGANAADRAGQPPSNQFDSWRPPEKRSEAPSLDPAEIEAARAKAAEGLNVTVSPIVEQSSLQSALQTLQAINAEIAKAHGGISALNFGALPGLDAHAHSFDIPSVGRRLRADFSSAGDPAG
jgi:hypothetical protein